ncbi:MAG: hypothetical protein KC503_46545 [Myxococcales bacterium]|nr:hypothetical protein [Myxococcales bacterium]
MSNKRQHKRQLRNFLLDRKVQLRIALTMVLLTAMLTTALGFFWYAEMRKASSVIRINAISTLGKPAATQLDDELARQDRTRLLILVGFATLFALLICAYGIVMTHKIAGPLFKIKRYINDIEQNRLDELWPLRRTDQLQEFFTAFRDMHGALRARVEGDVAALEALASAIEGGEDLAPHVPRLRELIEDKNTSLRPAAREG